MSNILALDPGIRIAGVALLRNGIVEAATCIRNSDKRGEGASACASMAREIMAWARHMIIMVTGGTVIDEFICEWPQIYTRDKSKGDPNLLIQLAGVCSAVAASFPYAVVTSYKPADWKGQVPKKIMLARILGCLNPAEDSHIEASESVRHNAIDAVGVGLFHVGRLGGQRVYPR